MVNVVYNKHTPGDQWELLYWISDSWSSSNIEILRSDKSSIEMSVIERTLHGLIAPLVLARCGLIHK